MKIRELATIIATCLSIGCATVPKTAPKKPQTVVTSFGEINYDKYNFYAHHCKEIGVIYHDSLDKNGKYSQAIGLSQMRIMDDTTRM